MSLFVFLALLGLAAEQGKSASPSMPAPSLQNNFNLPNASFGAAFNYVAAPAGMSNPQGNITVSTVNVVTPGVTVQTPTGPVANVTLVTPKSGNAIFGVVQGGTPAQQQAVQTVLGKVSQQLRGV